MKNVFFVVLFFALSSCLMKNNDVDQVELFEAKGFNTYFTTFKLEIISDEYCNSNQIITMPVNTWQPLLKLAFLYESETSQKEHCLIYKLPGKGNKILGKLKMIEIGPKERCQDVYDRSAYIEMDGVFDLKVFFVADRKYKVRESKKELPTNSLSFNFKVKSNSTQKVEERWIFFPLMNLVSKENKFSNARYSSSEIIRKNPGVSYWPLAVDLLEEKKHVGAEIKMLGSWKNRLSDQTLIKCHDIDEKCRTILSFQCDRCRYGWFEVISSKCETVFTKFCGPNNCGQKGEPACIRGLYFSGEKTPTGCYNGNPAGFCHKGLAPHCNVDNILECR